MSPAVPPPVALAPLTAPDRDFETIRAEAIEVIVADAGPTWTDHNLSDPGITLLELLAYGIADLHYRTSAHDFTLAPLELPLWVPRAERDWYGLPPLDDPGAVATLAGVMATPVSTGGLDGDRMAKAIAGADSRRAAIGALLDQTFGDPVRTLSWAEAATVVALLRAPIVRRAVLDHSDAVADAYDEARRTIDRRTIGPTIDEDAVDRETIRLLGFVPALSGLWDDEVLSLIRRHRHELFVDRAAALLPSMPGTIADVETALGVGTDLARAALALHPCPPSETPETWEADDGTTTTWPPHPLQARTTEPVTDEDYATRARTNATVHRAWTVPHILPGLGWDGTERTTAEDRPGAVTILVEPVQAPLPADRLTFLRSVLVTITAGPGETAEVDDPYDPLSKPDLQVPRRLLGDELGVALLQECPVTLNGVLHVALGVPRTRVIDAATARVAAFFAAGRPESAVAVAGALACPGGIEGPWPPAPQPAGGWRPGEAIRMTELIQVLADDPEVIGIEGVEVQIGGTWYSASAGATEVPLDPECIPVMAKTQCLQVRLELGADCNRG